MGENMKKEKLIAVVGTTASGKSDLGILLAKAYGGEIVSADSRQVYRHLDLGTGKVTKEEMAQVKHHLIDVLDLNEPFSLADFQNLAYTAIDGICERGKLPFLVGGTGLYARAVTDGYCLSDTPPDEKVREELSKKSREELIEILKKEYGEEEIPAEYSQRRLVRMLEKRMGGVTEETQSQPRYDVLELGVTYPREILCKRIGERLDRRIEAGMVEEVKKILELGATPEFLEGLGLEYRLTYRYVTGGYADFAAYRDDLFHKICQFAKRQMTWFRKDEKILWLDPAGDPFGEAKEKIDAFLKN